MLTQEPPTPPEPTTAFAGVTPVFYIAILIIIAGIVAWKYKATREFIVILCSTIVGFIIGCCITGTGYISIGLGMALATAGLLLSIAVVVFIRIYRERKTAATSQQ